MNTRYDKIQILAMAMAGSAYFIAANSFVMFHISKIVY